MKKTRKIKKLETINEDLSLVLFELDLKKLALKHGITDYLIVLETVTKIQKASSTKSLTKEYGMCCILGRLLDDGLRKDNAIKD